jgi:hypothetical protein
VWKYLGTQNGTIHQHAKHGVAKQRQTSNPVLNLPLPPNFSFVLTNLDSSFTSFTTLRIPDLASCGWSRASMQEHES